MKKADDAPVPLNYQPPHQRLVLLPGWSLTVATVIGLGAARIGLIVASVKTIDGVPSRGNASLALLGALFLIVAVWVWHVERNL